jgi:carnitine 3-dehydrogenase
MLLHVDTGTGRVCPMAEPLAGRVGTLARLHSILPAPDGAGRYVGQPRS